MDTEPNERMAELVEGAVLYGLFEGQGRSRREFFKLIGAAAALAIIKDILPLNDLQAWAADAPGKPEKADLKPSERSQSAREVAWALVLYQNEVPRIIQGEPMPTGAMPPALL